MSTPRNQFDFENLPQQRPQQQPQRQQPPPIPEPIIDVMEKPQGKGKWITSLVILCLQGMCMVAMFSSKGNALDVMGFLLFTVAIGSIGESIKGILK